MLQCYICYTDNGNLHLIYRIKTWEDDIIEDKIFKKDRGYLKIRDILKIKKIPENQIKFVLNKAFQIKKILR